MPRIPHRTKVSQIGACVFEKKKRLSVNLVISYGAVAADKAHITTLAFTIILHDTIGPVTIFIAELESAISCDEKDKRMAFRRYNPALLLPSEEIVNILTPIIMPPGPKAKKIRHGRLPLSCELPINNLL